MDALWYQYERSQLAAGRRFEEQHPEVEERTLVEEIHEWENWALVHFSELQEAV